MPMHNIIWAIVITMVKRVTKNFQEAVKWYREAAEQGNADAQCNLGYCYEIGNGVAKNSQEAVKWYGKSAGQGHTTAQRNLANCYAYGRGVPKNQAKADYWYQKANEGK